MNHSGETIGGLDCQIVDFPGNNKPEILVVLCHGFGAPGDDLVPIGFEVANEISRRGKESAPSIRFVFPAAPLSLDSVGMYGGRAWWHLDLEKFQAAIDSGEERDLRQQTPPELPAAREQLLQVIEQVLDATGLSSNSLILGGFSQGSMLTTDVALRMETNPAGLFVWSGNLLNEDEWRDLAPNRKDLKVYQSHGTQDPILSFQGAIRLRDMLLDSEIDVEFFQFPGIHTIPREAIGRLADRLMALKASS